MNNLLQIIPCVAICACIVLVMNGISGCEARSAEARAKVDQEAAKAGLQQGEYGRWVKP